MSAVDKMIERLARKYHFLPEHADYANAVALARAVFDEVNQCPGCISGKKETFYHSSGCPVYKATHQPA